MSLFIKHRLFEDYKYVEKSSQERIFSEDPDEVLEALKDGIDVDYDASKSSLIDTFKKRTPLMEICKKNIESTNKIIDILIKHGASVNIEGAAYQPLEATIKGKNKKGTLALIKAGATLEYSDWFEGTNVAILLIESKMISSDEIARILRKIYIRPQLSHDHLYGILRLLKEAEKHISDIRPLIKEVIETLIELNILRIAEPIFDKSYKDKNIWFTVADILEEKGFAMIMPEDVTDHLNDEELSRFTLEQAIKVANCKLAITGNELKFYTRIEYICAHTNDKKLFTIDLFKLKEPGTRWNLLLKAFRIKAIDSKLCKFLSKEKWGIEYNCIIAVDQVIQELALKPDTEKDVNRMLCNKVKLYLESVINNNSNTATLLFKSRNEMLIYTAIDAGLGEIACASKELSSEWKTMLEEAGYVIPKTDKERKYLIKKSKEKQLRRAMVKLICSDIRLGALSRKSRELIEQDPSLLDDDKVQRHLENGDENDGMISYLRDRYNQWLEENKDKKQKYDF